MRCNYIRAVGATLLTYVSVWSITTGRDTAKNVFVECKIASKKTINARPYDYRFQFRLNRYIRNGYIRSLQGCGAKHSSALMLREAKTVFSATSIPGNKTVCHTCVTRNVTVSSVAPNRASAKHSTALMYGGSFTVSSVTSTPGTGNKRIRSCVKALLKRIYGDFTKSGLLI